MGACSVTQLCPTLCDLTDHSLPDSSVHGIFLASILEWVLHWQADSSPLRHLESPITAYKDRFHFYLGASLTQDMKSFEVHPGFLQLLEYLVIYIYK